MRYITFAEEYNMSWKVKSSVVGGMKLSVSDREAYISFSRKLNDTAKELLTLKNLWLNAAMVIASQNYSLQKESETYINDSSQSFLTESMCNEYANTVSYTHLTLPTKRIV